MSVLNNQIKVDKLHAAGYQIDSAIFLFFHTMDDVSVCVLAGSASTILYEIDTKNSIRTEANNDSEIKEKYGDSHFYEVYARPFNFFRHANKDSEKSLDATITYNTEETDTRIYIAIEDFSRIAALSENMLIFLTWFTARKKDIYPIGDLISKTIKDEAIRKYPNFEKYSLTEQKKLGLKELLKLKNLINFESIP